MSTVLVIYTFSLLTAFRGEQNFKINYIKAQKDKKWKKYDLVSCTKNSNFVLRLDFIIGWPLSSHSINPTRLEDLVDEINQNEMLEGLGSCWLAPGSYCLAKYGKDAA